MNLENKWIKEFNQLDNKKVLLMLSGGKDSSACLHILSKAGIDVEAIHFTHKWGYEISTQEARNICKKLDVKLHEVDFSQDYLNAVKGFKGGRPCLLCKPEMYKQVIKKIMQDNFGCICIGDNADDRMTIVRLMNHIINEPNSSIYCNTYFGNERGIELPKGVKVLRPLLDLTSGEVELYLKENDIEIKKNNSTGDKYFEYAREGCPVQFYDPGYEINEYGMESLKRYNILLSEYARKFNIRASIHLPSTFIITIPEGYEEDALKYLETKGLKVNWDINKITNRCNFTGTIIVSKINKNILHKDIFEKLNRRFLERLEYKVKEYKHMKLGEETNASIKGDGFRVELKYIKEFEQLIINFIFNEKIEKYRLENLIKEIYRSRNYKILI